MEPERSIQRLKVTAQQPRGPTWGQAPLWSQAAPHPLHPYMHSPRAHLESSCVSWS